MGSNRFSLSSTEAFRFYQNTLLFLAPLAVIYAAYVKANIDASGFSLDVFVPNNAVLGALTLYVLNTIMDFLRKFVPDTR